MLHLKIIITSLKITYASYSKLFKELMNCIESIGLRRFSTWSGLKQLRVKQADKALARYVDEGPGGWPGGWGVTRGQRPLA